MDTRTLIALGMILALVGYALHKGSIDGGAVKDIALATVGGIIGFTLPSRRDPPKSNGKNGVKGDGHE